MTTIYCELATLTSEWLPTNDTDDDTLLAACLEAASRKVDAICNRRFYLDDSASARTFTAAGIDLHVDDIGTTTGLVVKEDTSDDGTFATTLVLGTDYVLAPATDGRPYVRLRRIGQNWQRSYTGRQAVQVTAKWGWPAVPSSVEFATRIITKALYKRKDSHAPGGLLGTPETGVFRVSSVDSDVYGLLAPVRKLVVA